MSPARAELRGLRVGLLENGKPNPALVLETLAAQLRAASRRGVSTYAKSYFGTPVQEDRAREIAQSFHAVLAGAGDRGSCSAAGLADGIVLERAGVRILTGA